MGQKNVHVMNNKLYIFTETYCIKQTINQAIISL